MDWTKIFDYNPGDGSLTWKHRDGFRFSGRPAGIKRYTANTRYPSGIGVSHRNRHYKAHRVIWEMHYGPIPKGMLVDHMNRDPFDNRLSNLRLCTRSQNNANAKQRMAGRSGFRGVHLDKTSGKWVASIRHMKKRRSLGYYARKEDAMAAYIEASIRLHGEFSPHHPKTIATAST